MNAQTNVYQPYPIITVPAEQMYAAAAGQSAAPVQPVAPQVQQYVLVDAAGRQTVVMGTAQSLAPVIVHQAAPMAGPGPATGQISVPAVPVWLVRLGLGALALVGVGVGLHFLAEAIDALVHALAELVHFLVEALFLLGIGAVGIFVLKAMVGGGGGQGGGQGVNVNVNQYAAKKMRFK